MKRLFLAATIGTLALTAQVSVAAKDSDDLWKQAVLQTDAEYAVRAMLRDPDSATFGDIDTFRTPSGAYIACGRVNAKNGFGGYGGFKRFVSRGTPGTTVVEGNVSDFQKAWSLCR